MPRKLVDKKLLLIKINLVMRNLNNLHKLMSASRRIFNYDFSLLRSIMGYSFSSI